jgi:hypothetical protein
MKFGISLLKEEIMKVNGIGVLKRISGLKREVTG